MAQCVNTAGSYKCVCPTGYKLDEKRNQCDDIDECALGQVCPTNSHCRNTPGSYTCECKPGFRLVSHLYYACEDINECDENPNICDHKCVNTYGSYQCTCNEGYKLAADRRTCVDIDECALQPNICPGICTNTPGSYECSCPVGFILDIRQRRICEGILLLNFESLKLSSYIVILFQMIKILMNVKQELIHVDKKMFV
jgi:fibulin 1/2